MSALYVICDCKGQLRKKNVGQFCAVDVIVILFYSAVHCRPRY
jgi:hypothetical protein